MTLLSSPVSIYVSTSEFEQIKVKNHVSSKHTIQKQVVLVNENRPRVVLLPTSQPSEDARLARRQRIVPREGCCMQKKSRSSVSVSVRCNNNPRF